MNIHHRLSSDISPQGSPKHHATTLDMTSDNEKLQTARSSSIGSGHIENTATSNQSVFNLVNGILGVGILGFPYAFKMSGVALATLFLLFIMMVTLFSCDILLASCHLTGKKTYEDLAFHTYGRLGRTCIHFCVLAVNLGAMVSYLNVLADVLSSVSGTLIPPGLEPSRNEVLVGITLLAVLPVAIFVQDAQSLVCVSVGSVMIIFIFTLMMILSAMQPLADTNLLTYWDNKGAFVSFPVIVYGFTIHIVIFPVLSFLRAPTPSKMSTVVNRAAWLCGLVYLSVGLGGYLTFGSRTHGDILRNLGAIDMNDSGSLRWVYERLLKLSYGVSIVGTVPAVMLPSISLLVPLCDSCVSMSRLWKKRLLSTVFVGVAFTCAVLIPNVEFILGLNGGTSSIVIAYIMPGLIYLKVTSPNRSDSSIFKAHSVSASTRIKSRALIVMGVILGVLCTTATLNAVHQENEVVQLVQNLVDQEKKKDDAVAVGQKTLEVVKTVDVVESASKEIGDIRGDTQATIEALHKTALSLNESHNSALPTTKGDTFWAMPKVKNKPNQGIDYKTVLANLEVVIQNLNSTLTTVSNLQEKLKALSEEIASSGSQKEVNIQNLSSSENQQEIAEAKRIDSLVKDLKDALGLSWTGLESEQTIAESTSSDLQRRFNVSVQALTQTLQIMEHVKGVVRHAMDEGKTNDILRDLVSSAMQQAIQATKHSQLALELTSKALKDAGKNQKSELLGLLSAIIKEHETDYEITEKEKTSKEDKQNEKSQDTEFGTNSEKAGNASEHQQALETLTKIVSNVAVGDSGEETKGAQKLNVTDMKNVVKKAINFTSTTKENAVSKAQAAVEHAHPDVAAKAGVIVKEFKQESKVEGTKVEEQPAVDKAKTNV